MQHLKTSLPLNYPQPALPAVTQALSIDNVQISALLTGRTELARALCQVLSQVLVGGLELEHLQEGDIKVETPTWRWTNLNTSFVFV